MQNLINVQSRNYSGAWKDQKVMIAGCGGQIGSALTEALAKELGKDNVIAADLAETRETSCKYYQLDVTDGEKYR